MLRYCIVDSKSPLLILVFEKCKVPFERNSGKKYANEFPLKTKLYKYIDNQSEYIFRKKSHRKKKNTKSEKKKRFENSVHTVRFSMCVMPSLGKSKSKEERNKNVI